MINIDELVPIYLEYVIDGDVIKREEEVSLFILKYRFPYKWNPTSDFKERPITIKLPIKLIDSKYFLEKFFELKLHPEWKKKNGKGLIYG